MAKDCLQPWKDDIKWIVGVGVVFGDNVVEKQKIAYHLQPLECYRPPVEIDVANNHKAEHDTTILERRI